MSAERSRESIAALRAARSTFRIASAIQASRIGGGVTTTKCRACGQWFAPVGKSLDERTICQACRERAAISPERLEPVGGTKPLSLNAPPPRWFDPPESLRCTMDRTLKRRGVWKRLRRWLAGG